MRRLLGFLVFLAILLVALDRGAWFVAERGLATEIQRSQNLAQAPDVSIKGFPFLTQALRGRYTQVDGTIHDLSVDQGVTVSRLDVQLRGVHVTLSDLVDRRVSSAPVDDAAAQGLVSYAALDAAAKANLPSSGLTVKFGLGTDGHLAVTGEFRNAVLNGKLNGQARVTAQNGALVVALVTDSLVDVPELIRSQLVRLLGVSYQLPPLPFGFQARSVTVAADGVHVKAEAQKVELTGAAG